MHTKIKIHNQFLSKSTILEHIFFYIILLEIRYRMIISYTRAHIYIYILKPFITSILLTNMMACNLYFINNYVCYNCHLIINKIKYSLVDEPFIVQWVLPVIFPYILQVLFFYFIKSLYHYIQILSF